MNSLGDSYKALVIGSTGTLGAAFLQALEDDPSCVAVHGWSRAGNGLLLEDEASIAGCAASVADEGPFQLIIDATGALTIDGKGPEKQLASMDAQHLMRSFQINTVGPALLLKHLAPLLDGTRRAIYAKLSARVGSISDNRKGGWYGYRSAKAALNMMLQCAAIEIARRKPLAVVAALQPGTVVSPLTKPFIDADQCINAQTAVAGMLAAMDGLSPQANAQFVDFRGNSIPW